MSTFNCSKHDLLLSYIEKGRTYEGLSTILKEDLRVPEDYICFIIKDIQKHIIPSFNKRWNDATRRKDLFLKNNSTWLDTKYIVTLPDLENVTSKPLTSSGKCGRPYTSYEDSAKSSKKRKNTMLLNECGFEHIYDAYLQGLRSKGEEIEAKLVETLRGGGSDEKRLFASLIDDARQTKMLPDLEALSVFIDLDLTKEQYQYLRKLTNERNCLIFPPYHKIQEIKKTCYPPSSALQITNTYAKVLEIQDILDHTAASILTIDSVYKKGLKNLILYSKWGCDGSSGQSQYKQKLPEESEFISDANLFIVSMVPLKLINEETRAVVWQNPVPSSVRFCRPILIEFCKETPEKIKDVVDKIKGQINSLASSLINKEGEGVQVKHELFLTMIDGKVAQVLTDTPSSSTCTICGATPRQMNDLRKVATKPENEGSFQYGLSPLHAWIRCMEMILHISYNLNFQTWSASNEEKKRLQKEKKILVQKRFREMLGLIIDQPRQGSGNTNDGNTARRFFYHGSCSAEITGVDEHLINRFYIILQAISSGLMINAEKFGSYAVETARIYVNKYPWYYMPSSIHKILIHGESIIKHFGVLSIGQLSEEAQESRNKDYKKFRLHHARKCSRIATNEDVFHTLLYTSDPSISNMRKPYIKNVKELDEKVNELISNPEF